MKSVLTEYSRKDIEIKIEHILKQLRAGIPVENIKKEMKEKSFFDEFLSMAKARLKNAKTIKKIFFTEDDIRFATPDTVAAYRAERLRCNTLLEIGCGIGLQTIAFAQHCNKVIAIDIDPRKVLYAQKNCEKEGLKNVTLLVGDALDTRITKQLEKENIDIIFIDPERSASEKERSIETIQPDVRKVLTEYKPITENVCMELPPQIRNIPFSCEKEYVSLNGKLNRLHLYFGTLQKEEVKAVALPNKERISKNERKVLKKRILTLEKKYAYIADVDEAVVKAGLVDHLPFEADVLFLEEKCFLLCQKRIEHAFIKPYAILAITDEKNLIDTLHTQDIGTTLLRGAIPEKDYWRIRKEIEQKLHGKKVCRLFFFDKIIISS